MEEENRETRQNSRAPSSANCNSRRITFTHIRNVQFAYYHFVLKSKMNQGHGSLEDFVGKQ